MLSKNVNNKKCAPKLIFFNEKKIEKDSDNFWHRKLTLKVKRLGDFALFDTSPLVQFSKFNNFLLVCWFLGKNLSNFVPPVWKLHDPYCHNQERRTNSVSSAIAHFLLAILYIVLPKLCNTSYLHKGRLTQFLTGFLYIKASFMILQKCTIAMDMHRDIKTNYFKKQSS